MKRFEIFLMQHSHIDIGYTDRQERIAEYQADFIKQAVNYALSDKQTQRDNDSSFKFTCEGFWPVELYLKKYGEEGKRRFVEAARKGYIEISPFYIHLAELLDQGHIEQSLRYAVDFARENDLKINSAMASDINGFSWGMAEALADAGVKYLLTNLNSHHGGAPLGKPLKTFYWETPTGKKILVYSGLAYHKANLLGLIPGMNPLGDPGIPGMIVEDDIGTADVKDISMAEKRVFQMVDSLKDQGYEYDFLPIMGGGLYTDNCPPTEGVCDIVADWNKKYGDKVYIHNSTQEEFFRYLEKNVPEIPSYRGEWTDWWTDGTMSTPFDVRLFRNAQRTKRMVEALDPGHTVVSPEELDDIAKNLILFSEHTWGHSNSYTDPWKLLVAQLQARKAKLAIDADYLACRALDKVQRALGEREFSTKRNFEYTIINPINEKRRFVANLMVDFWEVSLFDKGFRVTDRGGNEYKCQQTNTLRGWTVAVEIELDANEKREVLLQPRNADVRAEKGQAGSGIFQNKYYTVKWDSHGISSLNSNETGSELLNGEQGLGAPVYSVFPGANRSDAAGFGYSTRKSMKNIITPGTLTDFRVMEEGDVFTTVRAEYQVPGASLYRVFYTFYTGLNQINVNVEMTKDVVVDPEGMYTALPFSVEGGKWYLDKPGSLILPGKDQIPGTCCDYYAVTSGVILAGDREGVIISTLDAPMLTIGGIKLWNYTTTIDPVGTAYSWLCNNKWETNFRIDMGGFYESRYIIQISGDYSDTDKALRALKNNDFNAVVLRK